MDTNPLLAIALLMLGLERVGIPIPGWFTGLFLVIVAVLMLL